MPSGYFSSQRDNEIIAVGGFFCLGCLVGKPAGEQSQDTRYCQGCYEFLLQEAEMLTSTGRRTEFWKSVIKGSGAVSSGSRALPVKEKAVSKLPDKGMIPLPIMKHAGGRPRKGGKVSRATMWRRNKKGKGVLI